MEVPTIRSRYIQDNLRRAIASRDRHKSHAVAREFRRYFQWFAASLPERDRSIIDQQLKLLEGLTPTPDAHDSCSAQAA